MNKENDGDWDNSLTASNSGNNLNTFDVDDLDMDYLEQLLKVRLALLFLGLKVTFRIKLKIKTLKLKLKLFGICCFFQLN